MENLFSSSTNLFIFIFRIPFVYVTETVSFLVIQIGRINVLSKRPNLISDTLGF